jgi:2,5-furandicarboxylate decarboxylase 1
MSYPDLRAFLADLGDDLLGVKQAASTRSTRWRRCCAPCRATGRRCCSRTSAAIRRARVVGNLVASRRRVAKALDTTEAELAATYLQRTRQGIAPAGPTTRRSRKCATWRRSTSAALLPVLTHYAGDGGPFVTTGVVLCTRSGDRDAWHGHPSHDGQGRHAHGHPARQSAAVRFPRQCRSDGKPLDIAIALGVEPALLIAAVVKAGPQGPDKMDIAGALRGAPVELVRAETVAVDVPARAEIIIEGRVLPGVREAEGPFGENTGYYFSNISPVVEVTAVTHRRDFIYPALCPGPPTSIPAVAGGRHRTAGPVAHPDGRHRRSRPDHRHLRLHRRHCL